MILTITIGCAIVALFDTIGSILSRRLNFKYTWLTIGSILIYAGIALYAAKSNNIVDGLMASFFVGLFDATIGLKISKKFKANMQGIEGINFDITLKTVLSVCLFAVFIGYIAIIIFG